MCCLPRFGLCPSRSTIIATGETDVQLPIVNHLECLCGTLTCTLENHNWGVPPLTSSSHASVLPQPLQGTRPSPPASAPFSHGQLPQSTMPRRNIESEIETFFREREEGGRMSRWGLLDLLDYTPSAEERKAFFPARLSLNLAQFKQWFHQHMICEDEEEEDIVYWSDDYDGEDAEHLSLNSDSCGKPVKTKMKKKKKSKKKKKNKDTVQTELPFRMLSMAPQTSHQRMAEVPPAVNGTITPLPLWLCTRAPLSLPPLTHTDFPQPLNLLSPQWHAVGP